MGSELAQLCILNGKHGLLSNLESFSYIVSDFLIAFNLAGDTNQLSCYLVKQSLVYIFTALTYFSFIQSSLHPTAVPNTLSIHPLTELKNSLITNPPSLEATVKRLLLYKIGDQLYFIIINIYNCIIHEHHDKGGSTTHTFTNINFYWIQPFIANHGCVLLTWFKFPSVLLSLLP